MSETDWAYGSIITATVRGNPLMLIVRGTTRSGRRVLNEINGWGRVTAPRLEDVTVVVDANLWMRRDELPAGVPFDDFADEDTRFVQTRNTSQQFWVRRGATPNIDRVIARATKKADAMRMRVAAVQIEADVADRELAELIAAKEAGRG